MYGLDMDNLPEYCNSGFFRFRKGQKHTTRICPYDVCVIMLEGTLYFNEDGKPVQVSKGEYYIQKSGLFQEGVIPSSDAFYYYIHFHGKYADSKNAVPISGHSYFRKNYEGFERLNLLQNMEASQVEKVAEFYRILAKLKEGSTGSRNKEILLQIVSLITEDYRKDFSLEELASLCGYSKNHLIRIFKEETGQTPFAYITNLRMNYACKLLENSTMTINEISECSGFGNYINFYKSFKKHMHMTPEEWRRSNSGLNEEKI